MGTPEMVEPLTELTQLGRLPNLQLKPLLEAEPLLLPSEHAKLMRVGAPVVIGTKDPYDALQAPPERVNTMTSAMTSALFISWELKLLINVSFREGLYCLLWLNFIISAQQKSRGDNSNHQNTKMMAMCQLFFVL